MKTVEEAKIELSEGNHTIRQVDSFSIQVTLDTTRPKLVIESPPNGFVTNEPLVTASGMINDTVVGTVNGDQGQVTINGEAAEVANCSYQCTQIGRGLPTLWLHQVVDVDSDRYPRKYASMSSKVRILSGTS